MMINKIKTNKPNETKAKPIAQPALYATLNAGASEFLAQKVVLKFAWVAIIMPTAPQMIETTAPTKKATPVLSPYSVRKTMTMNITTAKIMHIRY